MKEEHRFKLNIGYLTEEFDKIWHKVDTEYSALSITPRSFDVPEDLVGIVAHYTDSQASTEGDEDSENPEEDVIFIPDNQYYQSNNAIDILGHETMITTLDG